ncbi:hypothetical protein [Burkholderia sp. PU8-34]
MSTDRQSLRSLIDKWLAPTAAMPARVTRFSRITSNHQRCVYVETARQSGTLAIYFFRHDDGWYVFPQSAPRPTLGGRVPALAC